MKWIRYKMKANHINIGMDHNEIQTILKNTEIFNKKTASDTQNTDSDNKKTGLEIRKTGFDNKKTGLDTQKAASDNKITDSDTQKTDFDKNSIFEIRTYSA